MKPCLVLLLTLLTLAATAEDRRRFRVMTWNVENLFDTLHDEGYDDTAYLPQGAYGWNTVRYRVKLGRLARGIAAVGGAEPASLVGLCEVENDSVLEALTTQTALARLGYCYLVTHSRDRRGIDVALLYQPDAFRPLTTRALRVPYDSLRERPTRDILLCDGQTASGDTLTVAVCHLPSRRGGASRTAGYRCRAAALLRHAADSIARERQHFAMVIMGDFNDGAHNASVATFADSAFCVMSDTLTARGDIRGTYLYQGKWDRLDQIIVSRTLLRAAPGHLACSREDCRIFAPDFLLERDAQGMMKPFRTYLGTFYHGGYSDHLPLVLDLWW